MQDITTQPYNWNAQDYAINSQNQFQWAKELIPKLELNGNEAMLDIGCGDGKITAELARCLPGGWVVGVDSSEKMITLAQSFFPPKNYPNLSFQMLDARTLTFRSQFDIAFSNAALHWIVDQKAVLDGVQRSLKPGGRLLFRWLAKVTLKMYCASLANWLIWSRGTRFSAKCRFPMASSTQKNTEFSYKRLV